MLLTFTAITFAGDSDKMTMVADKDKGIWILDNAWGQVKHCRYELGEDKDVIICSDWKEIRP